MKLLNSSFVMIVMLLTLSAVNSAYAGTTNCVDQHGNWHFKQWRSDGGARPPEEAMQPHWFYRHQEQLDLKVSWLSGSKTAIGMQKLSKMYKVEAYIMKANIKNREMMMFCFRDIYVGPPRP